MAKQREFPTSTIQIVKPDSYQSLASAFRLVRYAIPSAFGTKKDRYKLLHVELRGQLNVPYRTFEHDYLDGPKCDVIYALYRRDTAVTAVIFTFLSEDPLRNREISFSDISTFNLVKLLQAQYFSIWPHFASMGDYYIHAKATGKDWHVCVGVKIQGATRNITLDQHEEAQQEFWVTAHARYFYRPPFPPNDYEKRRYAYYRRQMKENHVVFEQLPYGEVDTYTGELFSQYSDKKNPARLPFHAQNSTGLLPSRGLILHEFTTQFVSYLSEYGISARIKTRAWTQYEPLQHAKSLPGMLAHINLYDNRRNLTTHPLVEYVQLLEQHYTDYIFMPISSLADAKGYPVLVLLDTSDGDYIEGGLFYGDPDPYKTLYRQYPHVPKQSLNVNTNSQGNNKGTEATYLDYPLIALTEPAEEEDEEDNDTIWAMQLQVSLYQLYLKDVVINRRQASKYLPLSGTLSELMNCIYIRKQTYRGVSYHVALRMNEDQLEFYDLRDPSAKMRLTEVTMQWGYDWFDVEDLLLEKYHKDRDEGEEVKDYDLVMLPTCALELETVDETVLYKYDEITRRYSIRQTKQPVEQFQLLPHYDTLRPKDTLSRVDMDALGLSKGHPPQGKRENASVDFWNKLVTYDALLDDIANVQSRITYDALIEQRRDDIGAIFDLPRDKQGEYNTRQVLEYYKTIWDIGGFKSEDVQMSKGIWYNPADMAYVVGGVTGFNDAQDRANLIRHFDCLYGDCTRFDLQIFLEATAAQFIRYRQYTVYPFPFYLIEKQIQDVLYHQTSSGKSE